VLTLLTAALVLVSVLVGVLTAIGVRGRAAALDDLTERSGPLSVAAQEIYRALSDADATATSAFLASGAEPAELRARYVDDIAQAEAALAVAVAAREPADVSDQDSPLAVLSGRLSVYTGLVETARANNLQGFPVGAAYQQEASNLMRTELLPAAEELYQTETERVAADQERADGFPFVEVVLGLVALTVLAFAQAYLRRATRRMFNVGLLVATGAALVSLLWVLIAVLGVSHNVTESREDGSAKISELTETRVAALTARTNETLTLVARGSGDAFEEDYQRVAATLDGLLERVEAGAVEPEVRERLTDAEAAWEDWREVHTGIRAADDNGDYARAVELAAGADESGAQAYFDQVDEGLAEALGQTNQRFADEVSQASNAVTGTVVGVIVLALVMAVGSVTGIWQRLKEYR
jgi:tetrahydromethanopterin S-methyltransferase subunit G